MDDQRREAGPILTLIMVGALLATIAAGILNDDRAHASAFRTSLRPVIVWRVK